MLTDTKIKNAQARDKTYKISDFQGLYLEVTPKGQKYWRLKYRINKKEKRLAIGVYPAISLKEARKQKDQAKEQLAQGLDPSAEKQKRIHLENNPENTFSQITEQWYEKMLSSWAPSTAKKRRGLLNNDLLPYLGNQQVRSINTPDIVLTLQRIHNRGAADSAHNAKQVLNQIFSYAKQLGKVEFNVASDLNNVLPAKKTTHRPAITDPVQFGKLLADIDNLKGSHIVRTALSLAPLLFQRPGELCAMEWKELDLDKAIWTIPKEKKKERNQIDGDHIVPLSQQALTLIKDIQPLTGNCKYVFPNQRSKDKCMQTESLNKALRKLGYDTKTEHCAHGFRASARTMLEEQLNQRVEWIEQQLAHNVRDSLGRAYNRTKHLPERHKMMQKWAEFQTQLTNSCPN